jgi:hypothetical protein
MWEYWSRRADTCALTDEIAQLIAETPGEIVARDDQTGRIA